MARVVKHLPASAGDLRATGSIPGSGRSPGEDNGNPLQYSCLENPMDRGTWKASVNRAQRVSTTEVTKHTQSVHRAKQGQNLVDPRKKSLTVITKSRYWVKFIIPDLCVQQLNRFQRRLFVVV